jgi:hypothetical protein
MSHLLECAGPACGLGLCQIGSVDFDRIRALFDLGDHHVLIHSLLGGAIDATARLPERSASDTGANKTADLLRRVKALSAEEARALLEAQKKRGGGR